MTCNTSWWLDPLAPDVHTYLKLKEFAVPTFYGQSKQLGVRRYLVDWLSVVCEHLALSDVTYHLCMCLLDYYMDGCDIEYGYLHLAALSCLLLAAKLEECEKSVPNVSELNRYIPAATRDSRLPDSYDHKEYLAMELRIFKHFDCDVGKVTSVHYLEYYAAYLVGDDDFIDGADRVHPDTLLPRCLEFVKYFLDLSLQNSRFRDFRPSTVAASCIVAMRVALHLTPVWPQRLKVVTNSCIEELQTCLYDLLSCSEIGSSIVDNVKNACVPRRTD